MSHISYQVAINPEQLNPTFHILFAGEAQTAPGHTVESQVLDYFLVHWVISGKGTFTCRDTTYDLSAGECFFIFPGELVSYSAELQEPWRYRWIAFAGSEAAQLLYERNLNPEHPIVAVRDRKRISVLFYKAFRTLQHAGPGCGMEADAYFRLILGCLQASTGIRLSPAMRDSLSSEANQQLEKAIRWLTYQYAQPISLTQMAHSLGYHRTHLSKLFRERTGYSPMQFLMKLRMERAKLLLLQPLTIQQVASSVGFSDPLYFSKQFKKWYGIPPTEFKIRQLSDPCK